MNHSPIRILMLNEHFDMCVLKGTQRNLNAS